MSESGVYSVAYSNARIGEETHFVPGYAATRPASRRVLAGKRYEVKTHQIVAEILPEIGGNMIHAGTFFGDMLPSFSKSCKGTLFAFEPVLENYVLAKLCADENNLQNVVLFNAALGRSTDVVQMQTSSAKGEHFGGASRVAQKGQLTAMVPIDGIDTGALSVIQLDVEGFELEALKGASGKIRDSEPVVMVEDNPRACRPFLEAFGYAPVGRIPGLFIWATPKHFDLAMAAFEKIGAGAVKDAEN